MDYASARGGLPNCRVFLVLRDEQGAAGIRLWAVQDATWNMVALVNNPGAVVERYSYTPFGEATVLNADGTVKPAGSGYNWVYLFQGGRFDPVTGTTFFQNRDYDPTGVRWTTPDPLGYAGGDLNVYRAFNNNPATFLDPTGQLPFPIITGLVGGGISSLIQIGVNLYDGEDTFKGVGIAFGAGFVGGATGGLAYLGLRGVASAGFTLFGSGAAGFTLFGSGAVGGIGSYVTESALSGKPITAQGVLLNGAVGGGLGYGIGKVFTTIGSKIGSSSSRGWTPRPEGTRLKQVGNYWIKEVDPEASMFQRWWGSGSLNAQARALHKLGSMAPSHLFKNGRLVMQDVGTFSGTRAEFWNIWRQGSQRLRTPFNDIRPRNIGANGQIFDPAWHPIHQAAGWIAAGGGLAYLGTQGLLHYLEN